MRIASRSILLTALIFVFAACAAQPQPTATPTPRPPTATTAPTNTPQPPNATPDAPAAEATAESAASDAPPVARVDQDNTVLRGGPGTNYERAGTARSGDTFPITGRSGEGRNLWYQITLPDGTTAWVWSRVSTLQPEGAEIPEVDPPAS